VIVVLSLVDLSQKPRLSLPASPVLATTCDCLIVLAAVLKL
jgi:hypothetical protein